QKRAPTPTDALAYDGTCPVAKPAPVPPSLVFSALEHFPFTSREIGHELRQCDVARTESLLHEFRQRGLERVDERNVAHRHRPRTSARIAMRSATRATATVPQMITASTRSVIAAPPRFDTGRKILNDYVRDLDNIA